MANSWQSGNVIQIRKNFYKQITDFLQQKEGEEKQIKWKDDK